MAVADRICQARDAGFVPEVKGIGVDAAGIGVIVDDLLTKERDIDMTQIVAIFQGYKLNGAIKDTSGRSPAASCCTLAAR
jgi:phage terminase large subunit-like protein